MTKIGDLVIFGECDAPQAHSIARIVSRDGHIWRGEYLSKRTKQRYSGELCDTMVTPVADFGVRVRILGKVLEVTTAGPSMARYLDRKPRGWQERLPVSIEIS